MTENSPALIIFIDSFPWTHLDKERAPTLSKFRSRRALRPGMGYSVNLYYELFAGLKPDDIGFFNKWTFDPENGKQLPTPSWLHRPLDLTRFSQFTSRATHKLYEKIFGTVNLANIPFAHLHLFSHTSSGEIFRTNQVETLFNRFDLDVVLSTDQSGHNGKKGEKDIVAATRARSQLDGEDRLFVMLGDLDTVAHVHGMDSARYVRHMRRLDEGVAEIVDRYRDLNGPDAPVVVLSDHGMAPVHESVDLQLGATFGPMDADRYAYFLDSIFARIWVPDLALRAEIRDHLDAFDTGQILEAPERERYGISSRVFGDIIFQLDEGKLIYPSFMGAYLTPAMHGYHPRYESQAGVFLVDGDAPKVHGEALETLEAHDYLHSLLDREA